MISDRPPFFVVGASRSGSTLLRLLLSAHSRIHVPPETWFIVPLVRQLPLHQRLPSDEVWRAVEIITSHYRWPDFGIPAQDLQRHAALLDRPLLSEIIDLVYDAQLRSSRKARIGDKTQPYIEIVPQLAAMYPGARFINLIRDGRDVAASLIELQYRTRYYPREGFEWTRAIHARFSPPVADYSSQILDIRYEHLVSDTVATLRKICHFLDEEFEAGMLDGNCNIGLVPERERSIHPKLPQPISRDAAALWRSKLSRLECFLMEACLRTDLDRLGYPLSFRGALWRPLLKAAALILESVAPQLDYVVPALRRRHLFPERFYI